MHSPDYLTGKIMGKRERKPVLSPESKPPKDEASKKQRMETTPKKPRAQAPKAQPSLAMIRLCRRLQGGSCLPNLKQMAKALNVGHNAGKQVLIARIVEALEDKDLPDSFEPTIEDATLSDDAFNEKVTAIALKEVL